MVVEGTQRAFTASILLSVSRQRDVDLVTGERLLRAGLSPRVTSYSLRYVMDCRQTLNQCRSDLCTTVRGWFASSESKSSRSDQPCVRR